MPLLFEPIYTEGLAQISYLVGDTKKGIAAVIDPRRDIGVYTELARSKGVHIAYAIETHIHADFVSGTHTLAKATGAAIIGGRCDDYAFPLRQITEGDKIELGAISLRALHTPGHTPEHVSFLIQDAQQGSEPFGIFTGDTLFNLDVGRPDLLGGGTERKLAARLHATLFDKLLPLGDRMEIFPCHGAGSACGKSIGDRRQSTIGNEKLYNAALDPGRDREAFVEWLLADMPEPPRHYARLKKLNAAGNMPNIAEALAEPLLPDAFGARAKEAVVVDIRSMLAFGGGHVPEAINIGWREEFSSWAGWMLDAARPVLLVAENGKDAQAAALALARIGIDRVEGYLHGGMTDWQNAAAPLGSVPQWTVHELNERRADPSVIVLDVRGDEEVKKGCVPGARHVFLPHLEEHFDELDRTKTIATYCGSGYRASIAASLLKKHGFARVVNVPGSWLAWKAAKLPVE